MQKFLQELIILYICTAFKMSVKQSACVYNFKFYFMQKQEIKNVNLVLQSTEGVQPLQNYSGVGFLTKDSTGFHFTERTRYRRTRNIRIAKLRDGTFMMYQPKDGYYRIQLTLPAEDMTLKKISPQISAMLKEARQGGLL